MHWLPQILSPSRKRTASADGARLGVHEDAEIFERFLGGDDLALVELFDKHNRRLYLYCQQFVGNAHRAEDITQELWERVIRLRTANVTTSQNPVGLFLTIARNLCVDDQRKQRQHVTIEDLTEEDHPAEHFHEMSELEELVLQALPLLPEKQREVLVLNAYSGYRFDEIAEMLGEPVGAIRTRAWRARTHLGRVIAVQLGMDADAQAGFEIDERSPST